MNGSGRIRVAILGATGHIARNLAFHLGGDPGYELFLFSRKPEAAEEFLRRAGLAGKAVVRRFDEFPSDSTPRAVLNCTGIGAPARLEAGLSSIFRLTESVDDLVLDHIAGSPETLYLNFSSGAAYGAGFDEPASDASEARFRVNDLSPAEFYGIAKLNAEAKHRSLPSLRIVDLRVFAFFSRFIDPGEKFLLTEAVACIRAGRPLVTGPDDIWRDYVHPEDLSALVRLCIGGTRFNGALDVYSREPVRKFELLDRLVREHGLRYSVEEGSRGLSVTGTKPHYFSRSRRAEGIGYSPRYTSLEAVMLEAGHLLGPPPRTERP